MNRNIRVRIRPFPETLNAGVVNNLLDNVETAIRQLFEKDDSGLSFPDLYRNVYNLVVHGQGNLLYEAFREILDNHLCINVRPIVLSSLDSENFLEVLISSWDDHQTAMVMISDILMRMDAVYVTANKLQPIFNLGLTYFLDQLIRLDVITEKMRNTILQQIHIERQGELINLTQVRQITNMLMTLGIDDRSVYEQDFEVEFLSASREFYQIESQTFLEKNSASAYVRKVEERILEETQRSMNYLDPSTEPNIVRVLEQELISKHLSSIVNMPQSGVIFLLEAKKKADLHRMYKLLCRVENGLKTMFDCISVHLREEGKKLVESLVDKDKAIGFVTGLLQLFNKYQEFLIQSFDKDSKFSHYIDKDFVHIVNLNNKAPEFVSLFLDEKLKTNKHQEKELSEQESESILTQAMVLFKFLNDKDMFEKYYKMHTGRRLLSVRSNSYDLEKFMISQLRRECGAEIANKLEGMFKDIHTAADVQSQFERYLQTDNIRLDISLNVRVLTVCHWSTLNEPPCNLPVCASQPFEEFIKFYQAKHNNRKLTIWHSASAVDLHAYFYPQATNTLGGDASSSTPSGGTSSRGQGPKREQYFFTTSTYQMAILMLFNQRDRYTFEEVVQEIGIDEADLIRYISPLVHMKKTQSILIDTTGSKVIHKDSVFQINENFSSKLRKVKIPSQIAKVESENGRRETRAKVEVDRRNTIDAAAVRIMKGRKAMTVQNLIGEVIDQLKSRFTPDPAMIRKRLEFLVERDFLSTQDHETYEYIS